MSTLERRMVAQRDISEAASAAGAGPAGLTRETWEGSIQRAFGLSGIAQPNRFCAKSTCWSISLRAKSSTSPGYAPTCVGVFV